MAQPTHTKVGALEEHRASTREFLKLIEGVSRREGWREGEAFTNFLYAAQSALASPLFKDRAPERFAKSEERYFEVLRACRHKTETMSDLSKMLAVLVVALEAAPTDFLGPIFSEIASNDKAGQFFTPFSLSEMLARMTLSDAPALIEEARSRGRGYILLQEPACGSGGMALAGNKVMREQGIMIELRTHWVCIDIDPRCVAMTYLQLNLTGASATVVHGNALSLEVWDEWPTLASITFPKRRAANIEPEALSFEQFTTDTDAGELGPELPALSASSAEARAQRRARWLKPAGQLDLGF